MQHNKRKIHVTPQAMIAAAIVLLAVPFKWLLAWFIAVTVHELSHCFVLYIFDHHIHGFTIDTNGAKILTAHLTNGQTLLCSFAGPAGGLLLLPFCHLYPELSLCALVQSAFNLLPIYPLDGGRILQSLTKIFFPEHIAKVICSVFAIFVVTILIFISLSAALVMHTFLPLLVPIILLQRQLRK